MVAPDRSTVRRHLLEATRALHTRLDAAVMAEVNEGALDERTYGRLLRAFEAGHRSAEAHLGSLDTAEVGYRPKAHLAAADLADLEVAVAAPPILDLADGTAARAGVLYVVEGSTLGARELAKVVPACLPRRFLHAYGEETVQRWRSTLQWIERHGDAVSTPAAAVATFETFASLMPTR